MFVKIMEKKIAVYTLGCKVNQYESDSMMDMLAAEGCIIVPFDDFADVYIINTCSVTNMAERKSRQIIHRAKKKNPNAVIVAAGCYVQAAKEQLEQDPDIDIVIGNNCKKDVAEILERYFAEHVVEDNYIDIAATKEYESMGLVRPREHCRAFVKVQDGCNNFCSYCIIPYTRGRIRSRKMDEVIDEIRNLTLQGIKEVVITGINLSSYCDEEGHDLLCLIRAVGQIDGLLRIRLGSLEPRIITERFLEGLREEKKFCPHFHLSLQSACNETLKRMNRHYTIEEYSEKCDMIRQYYDRPAITTDIIVGFPGETDEEFDITCENLEKINLYEMHVFKYSRRKGTVADKMPGQIPDAVKESRSKKLLAMTERHRKAFEASFAGQHDVILVEEYETEDRKCYIKGHTDRYIMVRREASEEFCRDHINKMVDVTL